MNALFIASEEDNTSYETPNQNAQPSLMNNVELG